MWGVVPALVESAENEVMVASILNEPARILCFADAVVDVFVPATAAATRGRLVALSPLAWRSLVTESLGECSPE